MAFDATTADLAAKAKLPSTAGVWFIANDCFTCEDVGLLASEEKLVDPNIIDLMIAQGDDAMKSSGKKVPEILDVLPHSLRRGQEAQGRRPESAGG